MALRISSDSPTRLRPRWSVKNASFAVVAIVMLFLVATPLLYLIKGTFFDDNGFSVASFGRAFGGSETRPLISNSVIFTIGSTALAMVVGTALAYLHARTDAPFKGLVIGASLVPMVIPLIVWAPAWVFLFSKDVGLLSSTLSSVFGGWPFDIYSMSGMIMVEGLHLVALVFLFMVPAFRSMDPSLEESARVSGAGWITVLRRITFPLSRTALASSAILVMVIGLEAFEVPVMLGEPEGILVFTSRIYYLVNGYPSDLGAAGALGVVLMVITIGLLAFGRVGGGTNRAHQTVTGKAFRPARISLGKARPWVGVAVLGYFFFTVVAPCLALLYVSLSPYFRAPTWDALGELDFDQYELLLEADNLWRAAGNTVIVAVISATVVMAITVIGSWFVVRSKMFGRRILDGLGVAPLIIPGVVLGLSLIFVYLRSPIPIYGTLIILVIAYTTRFIPYGMRYAGASLGQISNELEEAAQVGGASWWRTMRRVVLPLAAPGILSGWLFIFMASFRELSTTVLLASRDSEVLAVVLFKEYSEGSFGAVAALAVVMIIISVGIIVVGYKVGSRFGIRV